MLSFLQKLTLPNQEMSEISSEEPDEVSSVDSYTLQSHSEQSSGHFSQDDDGVGSNVPSERSQPDQIAASSSSSSSPHSSRDDVCGVRESARQRKRKLEVGNTVDFSSFVPNSFNGCKDFRKRIRNTSQMNSSVDRDSYNAISEASVLRCHAILKNIADFDWKMRIHGPLRVEVLEDVALVISPHNHLVDDAWRKLRAFITEWRLYAVREKLTDIEKANCVPKITRKAAFLVVIANSRKILKKVVAAERIRMGYRDEQILKESDGLVLEGVPLSPSPAGIRSSPNGTIGPLPSTIVSSESPAVKKIVPVRSVVKLEMNETTDV